MPAVLVELGFLTNPGEEDFLQSTRGKELLASAIYRAIKEYKYKRESRDAMIQGVEGQTSIFDQIEEAPPTTTTENTASTQASAAVEQAPAPVTTAPAPAVPSSLFFAVQLAVSRNDLPCAPENFKGLEGVWKEEQYGLFKYYCGKISTYKEVEALKTTVVEQYPDAYIVAFEKDRKIDLNEAKKRAP